MTAEERLDQIDAENIRRLANIASSHETRLESHEDRIDDLEEGRSPL